MSANFYVYSITDPRDSEVIYIGKGRNKRMFEHWSEMTSGKPRNRKLYNKLTAIFRAGYETPIYSKLIETSDEKLAFAVEVFWIDIYGRKNLCNLTDGGEGLANPNEETRKKMSVANLGNKHNLGRPKSEEHRRKISSAKQGKTYSKEHRRKISEGLMGKRRVCSEETRKKLRKALLGRNTLGKPKSEETRKKLSKAFLGKAKSEDHRLKMREGWARRARCRALAPILARLMLPDES